MDIAAFRTWLFDPVRSSEELFCAELLLEFAEDQHPQAKAQKFSARYEATREKRRRQSIDPGYRPRISRKRFEDAEPYFASLKKFSPDSSYHDRRIADLSALRFFPEIETVKAYTQLRDLSGLLPLSSLKHLSIHDDLLRDLSALRCFPNVQRVSLWLRHPWPSPDGLEALTACAHLDLDLNLQVLEGIPSWPRAEQVHLSEHGSPLRDLRRLPEMPVIKEMELDAAALDGIGRYPTLEKLKLAGVFEDLSPLAGLPRLRELTLRGERFEDLSPLARLPELRLLILERDRGIVLDPLLEAPRLRAVKAPQCKVITTELASLNAAISWQREDFALDPAPTPPPLRWMRYEPCHPETRASRALDTLDERELFAPGENTFSESESAWMVARIEKTMLEHLGSGWGYAQCLSVGTLYVAFFRERELRAAISIIGLIRSLLAVARFPWEAILVFDEDEEDDWLALRRSDDEDDEVHIRSAEDIEYDRQRARDYRAFLEREHQLRLGAQGLPIKPGDSEAEPAGLPAPSPAKPSEDEEEDDMVETAYTPLDRLSLTLTKEIAWIKSGWEEEARAILDRELEDWHALPQPPEQRPTPP